MIPIENMVISSALARSAWMRVSGGYFDMPSVITIAMSGASGRSLSNIKDIMTATAMAHTDVTESISQKYVRTKIALKC